VISVAAKRGTTLQGLRQVCTNQSNLPRGSTVIVEGIDKDRAEGLELTETFILSRPQDYIQDTHNSWRGMYNQNFKKCVIQNFTISSDKHDRDIWFFYLRTFTNN
jgi:hypothetical protein